MDQFQFSGMGKALIIIGAVIIGIGIVVMLLPKIPFPGKLPDDFSFKGKTFSIYIPLATSLILSVILTIIVNLFFRK